MTFWRKMLPTDLDEVVRIADCVHQGFPEDREVFAERLVLWPQGCHFLESEGEGLGYLFGHPWVFRSPPPLNSLLGQLPQNPGTYYLHDLALLPEARKGGHGTKIIAANLKQARSDGFRVVSLISVHASSPFWRRQGFEVVNDNKLVAKLASYGDEARYMECQLS